LRVYCLRAESFNIQSGFARDPHKGPTEPKASPQIPIISSDYLRAMFSANSGEETSKLSGVCKRLRRQWRDSQIYRQRVPDGSAGDRKISGANNSSGGHM